MTVHLASKGRRSTGGITEPIYIFLLAKHAQAHTVGAVADAVGLSKLQHAAVSSALTKLVDSGQVVKTTGPATSTRGRRAVNYYQAKGAA